MQAEGAQCVGVDDSVDHLGRASVITWVDHQCELLGGGRRSRPRHLDQPEVEPACMPNRTGNDRVDVRQYPPRIVNDFPLTRTKAEAGPQYLVKTPRSSFM